MVLAKKWLTNKLDMLLQTNKMAANILIRLIRSIRACYRLCPSNLFPSNLYKMAANKGVEGLTMGVLLLLIHGRSSYIHPATTAHSWQETTSHLSQRNGG